MACCGTSTPRRTRKFQKEANFEFGEPQSPGLPAPGGRDGAALPRGREAFGRLGVLKMKIGRLQETTIACPVETRREEAFGGGGWVEEEGRIRRIRV